MGVRDGMRTARVTRFVIPLFIVVAMVEFTYGAQTVQLVIYADRSLGLGDGGYGLLLAACGFGGLVSALFNGQLATGRRLTLVVVGAAVLACASQFVYASSDVLTVALVVTVVSGAALVCAEVVAETVLARVTPRERLGRIAGLFEASSIGAMVAGAVLASILVNATSLEWSFWILGAGTVLAALACIYGLRGLDEASRQRTEALARRLTIIEQLPITQGAPQLALEQLASASHVCPLPAGVDVVVQGSPAHAFYAVEEGRVACPSRRRRGGAYCSRGVFRRAWSPGQCAAQRNSDDGGGHDRAAHRWSRAARRAGARADADDGAQSQSLWPRRRRRARGRAGAGRRPPVGQRVTVEGATAVVVGAGYPGKRRIYERMAELGAGVVIVDEAGHWSSELAADGVASDWLAAQIVGDADEDARAIARRIVRGRDPAGRRPDLLGGVSARRGTRGRRTRPPRQPGRGRRCGAEQAAYTRGVGARRPTHAEIAARPSRSTSSMPRLRRSGFPPS